MIDAVVAVALGLAPVNEGRAQQVVQVNNKVASEVGRHTQLTRKDGTMHVRGFDRLGRAYDLTIDRHGHVEGDAGIWHVSFDIADAA